MTSIALVHKVLQTLLNYHIKIKLRKCEWFQPHIEYLGHIMSQTGIKKTPEYLNKIGAYPKPKNVGELRIPWF